MYRALIVDDEVFICRGLLSIIDWDSEGFSQVEYTTSPSEAVALIEQASIDLLITDVCMNETDGFTMLKTILEKRPNQLNIIISGHNDFEYARSAIKSAALDYLLKPIDEDELLRCTRHAKEILDERTKACRIKPEWSDNLCEAIQNGRVQDAKSLMTVLLKQMKRGGIPAVGYAQLRKALALRLYDLFSSCGIAFIEPSVTEEGAIALEELLAAALEAVGDFKTGDSEKLVRQACALIKESYSKNLSLRELAATLYVTPSYLGQLFKKKTTQSVSDYLHSIRIENAKKQLLNPLLSIAQVSDLVGYKTVDHFYRKFKEIARVTPREFRDANEN